MKFQWLTMFLWLCVLPATARQSFPFDPHAVWISPGYVEDSVLRPCPVFQKTFTCGKAIASATLRITAHGLYEAALNTKRVGDAYFTPGWTNYEKRLQYQQYDLKPQLKKGNNLLAVTIGEGWYRGVFGGWMRRDNYGSDASLLCQLDITYTDGSTQQVLSDSSWQSSTGAILHADLYGGELYDARITPQHWYGVKTADWPKDGLVATIAPPVRKQETFTPVRIFTTPKGEQVVDFGQNLAGWVQVRIKGKAGDTITLQHAEMLDKKGNFYTGNLREASAADQYILSGKGVEQLEPHFTWHGFRYVQLTGCDAHTAGLTAVALYSDMEPAGSFSCSDARINQLQHNISWSLKSNFLDVPTDCPQRSERLGWTGDAQVFFRTASFHYNVDAFFTKWLADLQSEQYENGGLPNVIPNIYHRMKPAKGSGVAGWGDAAVIIPWQMYWVYNDTAILRTQYNSMKAWVNYAESVSQDDCWRNNGYGDWLAPGDSTSLPFIDQCFWAHSTSLLVQTAQLLGERQDAAAYSALLQRIKAAFLRNYIMPNGKMITNTQTAYVLALSFDMLPDSLRGASAARLAALVAANGNHLATGFLGTPFLLHALSSNGYTKTAYGLLLQDSSPSWLYPVKMGATTIWERWNAMLPDSTVQATSFNHYSYGAVGDWLYRVVAGIDAASPGYKKIIIRPLPGGGLTWVTASYRCPYGKIVSAWKTGQGKIKMQVEIPAGTTARVYVPGKGPVDVGPGSFTFEGVYAPS